MTSSPLKWHGGKHYLAADFVKLFPPHLHYVEPYFGGGSVLFHRDPEGVSEVANDKNGELINFWRVLQSPVLFDRFHRLVECVPFSETEWKDAAFPVEMAVVPSVSRAAQFFIRCRMSLAGRMKSFAPTTRRRTRRGMNEQVSAWLNAVDGLPMVHARLRRVFLANKSALDIIRSEDGPNTFFYLDPPYCPDTRVSPDVYEFEMTMDEHEDLLKVLATIEGKFMLSGYENDLYNNYSAAYDWLMRRFDVPNNSASGEKKRRMVECVYMNY